MNPVKMDPNDEGHLKGHSLVAEQNAKLLNDNPNTDGKIIAWSGIQAIRCATNCTAANVVCLISCSKCGKQYVGEKNSHQMKE